MSHLIFSLIKNGNYLSYLLSDPKVDDKVYSTTQRNEIRLAVQEAFKSLTNQYENKSQLPHSFPHEKVFPKVLQKLKSTLETIENGDSKIDDLKKEIDGYHRSVFKQIPSKSIDDDNKSTEWYPSFPWTDDHHKIDESTEWYPSFPWTDDHHKIEYDKLFDSLNEAEKNCLLFCLGLLQKDRSPANLVIVRKRKLIHWWIGFKLIEDPDKGELVLTKLVDEEFLIPTSNIPRLPSSCKSKGYIIHDETLSEAKLEEASSPSLKLNSFTKSQKDGLFMYTKQENKNGERKSTYAVINTDIYTLNEFTVRSIIKEMDHTDSPTVEILDLGRWSYDRMKNNKSTRNSKSTRYVVVQNIEALESFLSRKSLKGTVLLSLQGIGGIVKLPDSVCMMNSLKVLDLKACPNLERLPRGISLLQYLTHLDVSECYLLDHIPRGLDTLKNLKVLKGFIINNKTSDQECRFDDLCKLKEKLIKLAVRARTTEFPTNKNLTTISAMTQLKKLKVVWVQSISSYKEDPSQQNDSRQRSITSQQNDSPQNNTSEAMNSDDAAPPLPNSLEKLELQAAPEENASKMLDLISYRSGNCPTKLYIRGGELWKLDPYTHCFPNVEILRFRYLHQLDMEWSDCQILFPNLSQLEVFDCPKLMHFPCGEDGLWNKSEQF